MKHAASTYGHCPPVRRLLRGGLIAALALTGLMEAFGQALPNEKGPPYMQALSIGLRGGYGYSGISIQPHQTTRSGKMLNVGMYVALRSTRHLALVLEPSFKRTSYTSPHPIPLTAGVAFTPPYTAQQEWIGLPTLLEARLHIGWASLLAVAGPYADCLLKETVQSGQNPPIGQALHSTQRNRVGIGLTGGLGLGVNTKWGSLVVEYRASYRLTDLYLQQRKPKLQEPSSNIREQTVSLGYFYTIDLVKP